MASTSTPEFRHIFVIEDQKARRIIALDEPTYSIGRESSNDIVIYDRVVSRHHATLVRIKPSPKSDNYSYRILDGDLEGNHSTNGLIINGQPAESHDLKHGDVVLFGSDSKASYYIISTSLEIALFNPVEAEQFEGSMRLSEEDNRSTIINDIPENINPVQASVDLLRLSSFAELNPNPIVEIDYSGKIIYLNPPASIKFKTIHQESLQHPVLAGLLDQVQNVRGNLLLREIQVQGEIYEQYVHYLSDSQVIRSYLCDITQRKQAEQSLAQHTFYDILTGLPNRALFEEQLAIALAKAQRDSSALAVLFLDFSNYGRIVNAFGLNCGEYLLKNVAQRLTETLGTDGLATRWQGEEFALLLKRPGDQAQIIQSIEKLLARLQGLLEVSGQPLHLKGRVGIALYPEAGADGPTLLKNAHTALEQVQDQEYYSYAFFSPKLASKSNLLFRLENLLYEALEKQQFYLTYQPLLNLKSQKVTSLESLLRWHHPELGEISPVNLIPLAEKTDLILPIGQWILRTACHQNKAWQNAGFSPLPVAVNLCLHQFQQPNLVEIIAGILQETQLDPVYLTLELPETVVMKDPEYSQKVLTQLQELGIGLCLDDFGIGLGGLSCLQQFHINTLKIHPSFSADLPNNAINLALIRHIFNLGHSLNIHTIAKGIENNHQVDCLQDLQCEEIQGFWFSKPLKAENISEFLAQHPV
ncbi:EAL domain-containing protein [Synechocystis sp. LKSZ1]|uniref:EAL domain-containing protein n=1 Tax=Synechocystis sp. LKSZ1 TaxID=3144951 RepID=UPI00336C1E9E